jgi:hypothetical protein
MGSYMVRQAGYGNNRDRDRRSPTRLDWRPQASGPIPLPAREIRAKYDETIAVIKRHLIQRDGTYHSSIFQHFLDLLFQHARQSLERDEGVEQARADLDRVRKRIYG